MFLWIESNLANIIICAVLIGLTVFGFRKAHKDHKNGNCCGSCGGCNCNNCSNNDSCQKF